MKTREIFMASIDENGELVVSLNNSIANNTTEKDRKTLYAIIEGAVAYASVAVNSQLKKEENNG